MLVRRVRPTTTMRTNVTLMSFTFISWKRAHFLIVGRHLVVDQGYVSADVQPYLLLGLFSRCCHFCNRCQDGHMPVT